MGRSVGVYGAYYARGLVFAIGKRTHLESEWLLKVYIGKLNIKRAAHKSDGQEIETAMQVMTGGETHYKLCHVIM